MRKVLTAVLMATMSLTASAQGHNRGMGGPDGDYKSLAQRVFKLEKKTDAINVYFNYASSFQAADNINGDHWGTSFKNKQARLEIKGNIGRHLSYRFRHRLNKSNTAQSEDNFAKATDILMVGYQLNDHWGIQGGKMCQNWGGFEFDENPMYIYQYSDFVDYMDNFMAGVNVSYKPCPSQEIALNVTNAYNNKLKDEYGEGTQSLSGKNVRPIEAANNPLTYILLWQGNLARDRFEYRLSAGLQTLAKHEYGRKVMAGVKLNLPTYQLYVDYMGSWEGLDRLGIASEDARAAGFLATDDHSPGYFNDVHYNSFVAKMNWQFARQWNLMVKGMYETVSVPAVELWKDYRKSYAYMASMEYFPVKSEDFRLFLAYVGRHYHFKETVSLDNYSTNRIELGFMYRLKIL